MPVRPNLSSEPVRQGEALVLQSVHTGKFCRVDQGSGGASTLVCDAETVEQATALQYTGSGV